MAKFAFSVVSLLAVASSQAFLLDDFSTGSYNSGYFSAGTVDAHITASGAVGGLRYVSTTITANPLGGDARARVISGPGIYAVGTESQVDISSRLGYGFANASLVPASNPLNLDLSLNPILKLSFVSNDVSQPVIATIYTNGGASWYSYMATAPSGITPSSPVDLQLDFTSVAGLLTDVDGIVFDFDPAEGGDFSLTTVQAVPEPASIAVIGMGVAALLRRRRK